MQLTRRSAVILFSIVILFWGLNWTVVKLIVQEVPPVWSAALRSIIAAAAVLVVQCATNSFVIPKKHDISIILLIGIFNMALCPAFMAAGVQLVPAGRSVVLGYSTPLWVAPAAWFFLHEHISRCKLFGIIIGLCGIVVLCNPLAADWGDHTVLMGYGFLLLHALSWAIAIIGIRAHVWMSTPFQLLFWQTFLASALLSLLALLTEGIPSISFSPSLILLLAYCGIPATALAFWAMTVINASLPATTTSLSVLATPIVGILGAVVFLGESVDASLIAATVLVLGGIALGVIKFKNQESG